MSNRPILHKVYPQNTKAVYSQNDILDFVISAPARKYVCNTFRIEGNVRVNDTGNVQKTTNEELIMDPLVGANCFFEEILTSSDNQGSIEVLQNAPRFNKMVASGLMTPDDACNTHNTCEMKTSSWWLQNDLNLGAGQVGGMNNGLVSTFAAPGAGGLRYVALTGFSPTGGSGTGLTVDTTVAAGAVTAVIVNDPGQQYRVGDVITINDTGANTPTNIVGGTGYAVPGTGVATTGGGGAGLTVDYTVGAGAVTAVTIADPGTGYTNGATITIQAGNANATFDIQVPDGAATAEVTAVTNNLPPNSFSVKPVFVLNQVSPVVQGMQPFMRSARTGNIRISLRLSRDVASFWGASSDANVNYALTNISMSFKSVPDDGNQTPLMLRPKQLVRQTLQSSFSNFSANVNGLVNGVSMTFLKASEENNSAYNNQALEQPPDISQVQYLFNDSNSKFLTFTLETQQEMMANYLESMSDGSINSMQLQKVKDNDVYGLGISFREYLDLSKDKFGMNLNSAIGTTTEIGSWIVYAYFHGMSIFE
jgi:hypothetical protein